MLFKSLTLLTLVSQAFAQNGPTLAEALAATPDLSTLGKLVALNSNLVATLGSAKNITILAPSNAAFAKIDEANLKALQLDNNKLTAILQYHVLNGTVPSSAIKSTPVFAPSLLTNPQFTKVTGGQRVKAQLTGGKVVFTSGNLDTAGVSKADVAFAGGVIHIIDTVLTLPEPATDVAKIAGLSSLRGAIFAAKLADTIDGLGNVTIFAPSNAAFQAIGSGLASLTPDQVTKILTYHAVVAPAPGYSVGLSNGLKLKTVQGGEVTVTINGDRIFVNGARVIVPDVLIAGGVVHVIDAVLNPDNTSGPSPSASAGAPAFSGASSVSTAPFTGDQSAPTRSIGNAPAPAASGAVPTTPAAGPAASGTPAASGSAGASASRSAPVEVSQAGANPTGVAGMGALLGAAAVYLL